MIIKALFYRQSEFFTWIGLISAIFVTLIWLIYLRRLDIFEKDRWFPVLITMGLGVIFTFFCIFLYDFSSLTLHFDLNGSFINDLLYCVFGIGLIEETVKIIPLLLILKFSKEVNEPYNFILYASASALGFALLENIMYFDGSPGIVHGRSVTSVLGHMMFTSIVAYGLILAKYRHNNRTLIGYFILYLLYASIAHGIYDFLIFYNLRFVFFIGFIILMRIWTLFIRNALNNSEFFTYKLEISAEKLRFFLIITLLGVLMAEYIVSGVNYGYYTANRSLVHSIITGSFVIFILSTRLSKLRLAQNYWNNINFRLFDKKLGKVDTNTFVGQEITIDIFPKDAFLRKYIPYPIKGRFIDRFSLETMPDWPLPVQHTARIGFSGQKVSTGQIYDPYWLLVKLEQPINLHNYCNDHIFLKYIRVFNVKGKQKVLFMLGVIPDISLIQGKDIITKDFKFIGRIFGE